MKRLLKFGGSRLLGLAAGMALAAGCDQKHPGAVQTPPPEVEVAVPIVRQVTDYEIFTARTQAVQSVDLKARVTGYLTKIDFQDGAIVKKDKVLFEIDNRPYKAALDKAKADLEFAQAALVKNQADYDIGLAVQKQDKAAISVQEIEKRKGARDESIGQVDQAKAAIEMAQLNFNWCQVTTPIDGRTNRHFVDVGNVVSADVTTLTNIVSLKPIWAYFDVDENSARRYQELVASGVVKSARKGEIPVAMALAGDVDYPTQGVVDFVSNQLDPNTGSIRLRAVFANADERIVAGLFGRVRVPMSGLHEALLVAESAIGNQQGQPYVLVVDDKNKVELRPVDVGQVHAGLREVKRYREVPDIGPGGQDVMKKVVVLNPTDKIIVNGLLRVRPEMTVVPRTIDMETFLQKSDKAGKKAAPKTKANSAAQKTAAKSK